MISKPSGGRGFKGCISYLTEKDDAEVMDLQGVMSEKTAAAEMRAIAAQSERCVKPVYHRFFSLDEGEHLTNEQWLSFVDRAEKALGLEGHQRIVVRHRDGEGEKDHIHVVWNRVNPETGRAVHMSNDYAKVEAVERAFEREHGLRAPENGRHVKVQSGERKTTRQATDGEMRREARTGHEPFARIVADSTTEAFKHAQSWGDLTDRLERAGLRLEPFRQGLTVTDGTESAGLSAVTAGEWTRGKLEKRFGQTWKDFQTEQSQQSRPVRDEQFERLIGSDPVPVRQRPSQDQGRQDAERLRQQYQEYRTQFFQQVNRQDWSQRSAAAWRKEQSIRAEETAKRRDEAQRRKAITRAVVGRGLGRKLAYKAIDSRFEKRAREDRARATERWEQAKAELKATPRPDVRPQEFKAWLTDQACHGNAVARRHLDRIEAPRVRTVDTVERPNVRHVAQEPAEPISAPQVEQDRQAEADRSTEAEWKRLIDARTADLSARAEKLLADTKGKRLDADRYLMGLEKERPAEPSGFAAVFKSEARYKAELKEWNDKYTEAQKGRNALWTHEEQLLAFLGRGDRNTSNTANIEHVSKRAAREVGAEHPELAKRMEAVRERQEARRRQENEQRQQKALERFTAQRQQKERDRSQGKGRGGAGY